MKLRDLKQAGLLIRPINNKRSIPNGTYNGETTNAEIVERVCNFTEDNTRVVLNLKVEVQDDKDEIVDLYIAPNYSWSKRGNMVKILENLEVLPAPGESIDLDNLVAIPVQVIVENVEKDGETYSNIASIKRVNISKPRHARTRPSAKKETILTQSESEEHALLDDDFSFDTDDDFEEINDLDELIDFDDPHDFINED